MSDLAQLLKCAGRWQGSYDLQPSPNDPIAQSPTEIVVTPLLRNTFLRIDQSWTWNDIAQSGSLLIGHSPKSGVASIHWIDTWHNGAGVMPLTGRFERDGSLIALGHFSVKDSPDWGWRIEIRPTEESLKIDMFCVNPANHQDEGGVRTQYRRA